MVNKIPQNILEVLQRFLVAGHEAYLVGGCVRDILMDKEPKDWDVTTDARPDDILKIFLDSKYTNEFGTVVIPLKNDKGETVEVIEATTFRSEQGYSDRRHPDKIIFEDALDKDLSRRDFTINALAITASDQLARADFKKYIVEHNGLFVVDFFGGVKDIGQKIIRAVGEPSDRFSEDALRILRAARFSAQLGFKIEDKTERAMTKMAGAVKFLAIDRIGAEVIKILSAPYYYEGAEILYRTKVLQYILPELIQGVGVDQSRHHIHDVFTHLMLSLKHCPSKDWRVRFATLTHDIAKPQTRQINKGIYTFFNHEYAGARIVNKIARRLRFPAKDAEKIITLVRNHMFYYNVDEVTAASVRRLIAKVGEDNLRDLIDVRIGDRLGSGVAKAVPYKLRHLEYMFERVRKDPVSVKMLAVNGDDLQKELQMKPSPQMGAILDCLLADVVEDISLNNKEYLLNRARELSNMDWKDLRAKACDTVAVERAKEDSAMRRGYRVN